MPAINPSYLQMHTSAKSLTLEKDDRNKKQMIKMAQEDKLERLNTTQGEAEREKEIDGKTCQDAHPRNCIKYCKYGKQKGGCTKGKAMYLIHI